MNILRHPVRTLLGALAVLLPCAFAQAQEDLLALDRLVAEDAARHLRDADPVVRGEATLVVAARREERFHAAVLAAARDVDAAARLRGIVALGLQATPGTELVIDEILADERRRDDPEGVCAAFALGLLPPDRAPALTSRALTSFLRSNLRRQRDALLALLLGLTRYEQPLQTAALRQLFDDGSVRDPVLRAQLLILLLPVDRALDGSRLRRLLARGQPEERAALLAWLSRNPSPFDADLLAPIEQAARSADDPTDRARALAMLTRLHHPPALEIAARALRSSDAAECGQGLRSVLALGGASMRGALDDLIVAETDPHRKAALFASFDAPPSAGLRDHCARLAADPRQTMALRVAAARLLARADAERAQPLLRDLFAANDQPALLAQLAADLHRGGDPPPVDRLLGGSSDVRLYPAHWRAMLEVNHPSALRQLLADLEAAAPPAGARAAALTLWRRLRLVAVPTPLFGSPPAVLVAVLGA